jgi:hypothetical protein
VFWNRGACADYDIANGYRAKKCIGDATITCPTLELKSGMSKDDRMSKDDIKDGQRINCNGVNGIVIGKRSTRKRRLVLVKMDNGFTLKLSAHTLSGGLPETPRSAPDA